MVIASSDNSWLRLVEDGQEAILSSETVLVSLLTTFLLSQLVGWVYVWTHRGTSYSRSFVHSLIVLSLVITTVMLAVGNSLARAFGLFGALALIRFRTPIKDTRDTTFLFLTVGIGICVGTGNPWLAAVGTLFCLTVIAYLSLSHFGERLDSDGVLRFALVRDEKGDALAARVLAHYCRHSTLLHVHADDATELREFAYRLSLYDPRQASALVDDLSRVPGLTDPNLFLQNEDEEP